jgi:hypothetical protein
MQMNLCRLNARLGNFGAAVAALDGVDARNPEVRDCLAVTAKAFVTYCYYLGFALIVAKQYPRALFTLSLPLKTATKASLMSYVPCSIVRAFTWACVFCCGCSLVPAAVLL